MTWAVDEHDEFWSSLENLSETPETADVVSALVTAVLAEPFAFPAEESGIRCIISPRRTNGASDYPALRLIYYVSTEGDQDVVQLLRVEPLPDEKVVTTPRAATAGA